MTLDVALFADASIKSQIWRGIQFLGTAVLCFSINMVGVLDEVAWQWWPCGKTHRSLIVRSKYTEHSQHVKTITHPSQNASSFSVVCVFISSSSCAALWFPMGVRHLCRAEKSRYYSGLQALHHKWFVISPCVAKKIVDCLSVSKAEEVYSAITSLLFFMSTQCTQSLPAFPAPLWSMYSHQQICIALCSHSDACSHT